MVHKAGEPFERGLGILRAGGSTIARERVRSIVVVEVTAAAPLVSPAYDTGATEPGRDRRAGSPTTTNCTDRFSYFDLK